MLPRTYILVVVASLLSGCSQFVCQSPRSEPIEQELELWHSSGGPGPIMTFLSIDSSGLMIYEDQRGQRRCVTIGPPELEQLRTGMASEGLIEAAKLAEQRGVGYFDFEEIGISTPAWSATFPTETLTPEVEDLLRSLATLVKRHFGKPVPWIASKN